MSQPLASTLGLLGKQKRYLRSLGTELNPILQIGKAGISANTLKQLEDALEARELVKIRVLNNCEDEPRQAAEALARAVTAELVQVIGRNALLYRPSAKKPVIELP